MNELHSIDLNLLKSLQALLLERHVGRAAQRMHVTQPAMSHALARLRRLFDDPLFVKQGRNMEPTPRAIELAPRLQVILSEISNLTAPPEFVPEMATGAVRIHAHDFIASALLSGFVRNIRRRAPKLTFEVHGFSERSYACLDTGDTDLIVGAGLRANPKFLQKVLLRDEIVCLLDNEHPALKTWTAETLFRYPHARLGLVERQDDPIHKFGKEEGMPPRSIGLVTDNLHLQPAFIEGTNLIAFVPMMLAKQVVRTDGLTYRSSPFPIPELGIRAIWHERDSRSPLHKWLRKELASSIQKQVD